MKAAKYNLVFNRKKKKLESTDKALIQIKVYCNRENKYISTGMYVTEDQWNQKERMVQNHPAAMDINIFLRNRITELQNYEYELRNAKKSFDLKVFDTMNVRSDKASFLKYIDKEMTSRADITKGTRKHHMTLLNHLKDHGKIRSFNDLTYQNIVDFDNYLIKTGMKQSTIHSQHKIIKTYIIRAISLNYMELADNPYLKFKNKRTSSLNRKYLTEEELQAIINKEMIGRIAVIRDLFIFSCYTGLSYSDAVKLKPSDVVEENGEKWLKIKRTKTENESVIMLLPQAIEVINRYKGVKKDKLLPYLSNQKMNLYLKIIVDMTGISKELTMHVARHTFATTVTLMNGVSLEVVQKMLGHTSIRTTEIYAKIVNERVKDEMVKLRSKLKLNHQ